LTFIDSIQPNEYVDISLSSITNVAGPFLYGNFVEVSGVDFDNGFIRLRINVDSKQFEDGVDEGGSHIWKVMQRTCEVDVPFTAFSIGAQKLAEAPLLQDGTDVIPEWEWTPPTP
jgi:hypothetical protein